MANELNSVSDFSKFKENYQSFVVRPFNKFGLSGLVFDIDGEQINKLQADITDHYVEDNSAIQDHIARKPLEVTLSSYIGELVRTESDSIIKKIQKNAQKLGTIVAYAPAVISSAERLRQGAEADSFNFDNTVDTTSDLWALTKNLNPSASKQQRAYIFFESLYNQNILVSLQTPWKFIKNMAIKTLTAVQDEETNQITNFSITLKQIRTVSTQVVAFDKKKYQSRSKQQKQDIINKGKAKGKKSLLSSGLDFFKG